MRNGQRQVVDGAPARHFGRDVIEKDSFVYFLFPWRILMKKHAAAILGQRRGESEVAGHGRPYHSTFKGMRFRM